MSIRGNSRHSFQAALDIYRDQRIVEVLAGHRRGKWFGVYAARAANGRLTRSSRLNLIL
jgi:hypothetical protein